MATDEKRPSQPLTLGMLIDHNLEEEKRLSQPLTLGMVRSICLDLLVDSAPSTKLVAIAILRRIDWLPAHLPGPVNSRSCKRRKAKKV